MTTVLWHVAKLPGLSAAGVLTASNTLSMANAARADSDA
jgi:hypothetical protein